MRCCLRALPLLLALSGTGCLPLLWAVPPVQVSTGIGTPVPDGDGNAPAISMQVGLHPLQLGRDLHARVYDIGAGYSGRWLPSASNGVERYLHGAHLESAWLPAIFDEPSSPRFAVGGRVNAFFPHRLDDIALGGAVHATIEWPTFVESAGGDCGARGGGVGSSVAYCAVHASYGEAALGFYLSAEYLHERREHVFSGTAGVRIRIPSSAGLGFLYFSP